MAVPTPILDLTTDYERQNIKVDGVSYLIKSPSDLTLAEYGLMEQLWPRVAALLGIQTRDKRQNKELTTLLDTLCRVALVAPSDVCDRLGDLNRLFICQAFTALLSPSLLRARAGLMGGRSGGTKVSRGSSGSTGASRRRGSASSRSGS